MATHPDEKRKDVLEQIARQAMQAYGFLPDFSADALGELEAVQQGDRGAEPAGIDLRHLLWARVQPKKGHGSASFSPPSKAGCAMGSKTSILVIG